MIRKGFLLVTLASLVALLASPASAEQLTQRVARGNNVGLGVDCNWSMPFNFQSWSGNTCQFPKGSGNFIYNDCWTFGLCSARDLTGDGTPEDTMILTDGGRATMPDYCSIEGYDAVTAEQNGLGVVQYARVWTSKDADELAAWPIEARVGHTASGAPIIHGAETMFVNSGDVFDSWGGIPVGCYMGWSMYFLDFAESNNMVYVHVLLENVTEYAKYNLAYGQDPRIQALPNGWTWDGMVLFENRRQMAFGGGSSLCWAYLPKKGLVTQWSGSPTISSFTPNTPPLMGTYMMNSPSLREQTTQLTNIWEVSNNEFGFSGAGNLLASGLALGLRYRCALGIQHFFNGQINPLTGREAMGWPGVLTPSDSRYNQWVWGGGGWNLYTFWGELKDVAPRDSMNFDFAIIFAPTGVTPLVHPTYDIANIDDAGMQTAFAPMERYADVAKTVYEGNYVVPATPVAPPLTIVPGDRQVTISWNDMDLQAPDPYYDFLQLHPELDPNKVYRQYDFEGFRLYRNYVGPNDSGAEMIYNCSLSDNNLSFQFVDKLTDDQPYYRMRNGLKVWYALVPYDINYDPSTGDAFSLPDPASGKGWNKAGESGLYNVVPRSDASNWRGAELSGVSFAGPSAAAVTEGKSVNLGGDGAGLLTENPKYLEPTFTLEFTAGVQEKITQDMSVYLGCIRMEPNGLRRARRAVNIVDASGKSVANPVNPADGIVFLVRSGGTSDVTLNGPVDNDGELYTLKATFYSGRDSYSQFQTQIDAGGYAGGSLSIVGGTNRRNWNSLDNGPKYYGNQFFYGFLRSGGYTITWKDAGGGNLTVEVQDLTRSRAIAFSKYIDDDNWGFMPPGQDAQTYATEFGAIRWDSGHELVPQSERTTYLVDKIPAANAETFRLWVDGQVIAFFKTGGLVMPSVGTVMTLRTAFGQWNSDKTVFTQQPDPVYPGEKWKIDIKGSTLKPEDADLSLVKVVPNPYIASSFLDLSPNQRRIEFINLPDRCTVRIYTLGGNLVNVLNHIGANRSGWGNYTDWDRLSQSQPKVLSGFDNHSGTEPWNLRNRFGQTVASGLYFFHVTDSRGKTYTGKFYVID